MSNQLIAFAVVLSADSNVIFQLHGLRLLKQTRFQRLLSYTMRGLVLLMIPVGSYVPSVSTLNIYTKLTSVSEMFYTIDVIIIYCVSSDFWSELELLHLL